MINEILKKKVNLNSTVILNLFSVAFLQGINFISMPIFTRVLGAEQFGLYSVFNTWAMILSIIFPLGLSNCLGVGLYYFKNKYIEFKHSILIYNIILSLIFFTILLLLFNLAKYIFDYNFNIYFLLLLTAVSTNIVGAFTGVLVFEKKAILNFLISTFISVLNVLLSIYIIFNFKLENRYVGRVVGHLIPYLIIFLTILIWLIYKKNYVFKFEYLKYGIVIGLPVVLHSLANIVLGQSDRVMMQKMGLQNYHIGIYSFFYSFTNVISIILGAFNTSFTPFYYDYIDNDDYINISKKIRNYIELFTIVCVGFLLLSREVTYVFADPEFYSGIGFIPIFVASNYFIFMYQFAVNYEFFYQNTKFIAIGTTLSALMNIILNYFLITRFGAFGAAYATIISYFLLFVFHYIIAKSMKQNRFYIKISDYLLGCITLTIGILSFYFLDNFIYLRWTIGFLIGIYEILKIIKRRSIF